MKFPQCRWAGQMVSAEARDCHSPKLAVAHEIGVTAPRCQGCYYRNHAPPARPSIRKRLASFLGALWRHARDWFRRRSKKDIARLLAVHCRPCPHYDGAACRLCGCCVAGAGLVNKLAWRSEHCPIGKW